MNNKEVMGNMLSVIRTAMITIIISFTSGVLLDLYKNVAPRIKCKIVRCKNINSSNKKTKEYDFTIKNTSKKTIHNLNVHIQAESLCESFEVKDTKITYGLKFDMSEESNTYSITIPLLSKNDEFSAKLVLEDSHNNKNKPIVMLRSTDNFKRVDTLKYRSKGEDNSFKKKGIITAVALMVIIFSGVMIGTLLNNKKEIEEPAIKSVEDNTINSEEKAVSNGTSNNSNKKAPSKNNSNIKENEKETTNSSDITTNEKNEKDEESYSNISKENVESSKEQENSSEKNTSSDKKAEASDVNGNENLNSNSNSNSKLDESSETKGANSNMDLNINGSAKAIE